MNTNRRFTIIAAALAAACLLTLGSVQQVVAQAPIQLPPAAAPPSAALPDEEALHQELRGLKKIYEDAVNSGNLAPLAPAFGPQTSGVVATNEEFHTLDEMQQIFDKFKNTLGPNYVYRVKLNPERSLITEISPLLGEHPTNTSKATAANSRSPRDGPQFSGGKMANGISSARKSPWIRFTIR